MQRDHAEPDRGRPIRVESEIEPVSFDFDKAVVLGLIANELVTNSVKHAFGEEGGLIKVVLNVKDGEGSSGRRG